MKRWKEKLEAWARAITYGEAADNQSAMEFLQETRQRPRANKSSRQKRYRDRPRKHLYRS